MLTLVASRRVLERFPGTKVVFGGDGEVEKNKVLAEELGIANHCEFHGWVSGAEREGLFARAAVYCLPSKNEGLPMSVLEAMARGIPTVATPVGGVPQVIEDGVSGFLVDVDDVDALSDRLNILLDKPGLRENVGAASRNTVTRLFNVGGSIKQLLALYRALHD